MSYDLYLRDPATVNALEVPGYIMFGRIIESVFTERCGALFFYLFRCRNGILHGDSKESWLAKIFFDFPEKEGEHMDESLLRKTG